MNVESRVVLPESWSGFELKECKNTGKQNS